MTKPPIRPAGRPPNGSESGGSVYWTQRRGRFECRASRLAHGGKRITAVCDAQFCFTGEDLAQISASARRAAENNALTKLDDRLEAYAPNAEVITVAQWIARDIAAKEKAAKIEESSRIRYESHLRNYIEAYPLGKRQLSKVTKAHCLEHFDRLLADDETSSNRLATYKLLKTSFERAVRRDMITHNPLAYIDRPEHETQHREPLPHDYMRSLVKAIAGHPYEALIWIAMTRGYRVSEIMALRWRDFDFVDGTLSVSSQLYYPAGKGKGHVRKRLKARDSSALFEQHPYVLDLLGKKKLGTAPDDYIFQNSRGGPLQPSNFRNRVWHPLLDGAGLERVEFHRLRNSAGEQYADALPGDTRGVRDLLRHATDQQTSQYLGRRRKLAPTKTRIVDDHLDRLLGRRDDG